MKRLLTALCLILSFTSLSAQQTRRVYITLDVSGSMRGDKYTLANYTAQMIASLCDPEDEVCLIIGGKPTYLPKGPDRLSAIQYPYSKYSHIDPYITQFGDIIGFNNIYSSSSYKQDWLFIIGDGAWETTSRSEHTQDIKRFQSIVEGGKLNICFLQTGNSGNERSDFLDFVKKIGIDEVKTTSRDTKSIKDGCDFFAKRILGFSDLPLEVKASGADGISLKSEMPLSEFIVVYQDEVESQKLPQLQSASYSGKNLNSTLKGTPTTTPVRASGDARLSGNVWRIVAADFIPSGETIELAFDRSVNPKNITIFPVVKEIVFVSTGLTLDGKELKSLGPGLLSICQEEKQAVVKVELNDASRQLISENLLKKTKVEIKANNRSYTAKYENGSFKAIIDLINDETQYYAEIDCPGYFYRSRVGLTTIRKVECEKPIEEKKSESKLELNSLTFDDLKKDGIRVSIIDEETLEVLDPNKFDFSVEIEEAFLYDTPQVLVEGDQVVIKARPLGDWCECLFPKDLNFKLTSSPKAGAFEAEGKTYNSREHALHLTIEKNRKWFPRCLWVVITLAGLLLLLIYFRSLMKKHRFKKTARITSVYYNYYGAPVQGTGGRYLRKEGFGAWLSRWFSPIDEKVTLSWSKPAVSAFTLVASDSKDIVNIPKKAFSSRTMSLPGYDSDEEDSKEKFIPWGDGETINVSRREGGKDGDLTFVAGEEDDGVGFRFFIGVMFVLCLVAFVILAWMMIRGIF